MNFTGLFLNLFSPADVDTFINFVLVSAGIYLFLLLSKNIFRKLIYKISSKTSNEVDDLLFSIIDNIKPHTLLAASLYLTAVGHNLSGNLLHILNTAFLIAITYQLILTGNRIIVFFSNRLERKHAIESVSSISTLIKVSRAVLWIIGVLFVLQNTGVNITSLIAGLGIGGVAVALAAQNILSDLFSSFAIIFDRPFIPGDFIIIGDYMGTVEKIGIKTTRIKALQGEEIIISNQDLTSSRLQNFKKLKQRRISFNFGVTYDTPVTKLKKIPGIIRKLISSRNNVNFDRSHFTSFGDSALQFETVYYLNLPDYNEYMDTHQSILLDIKKVFEKEKIEMAFPTQTVYIGKS